MGWGLVLGWLIAYPSERIVSASREMSSSNWVSLTPSVSIREVNKPCVVSIDWFMSVHCSGSTSSDSIVLHPPASAILTWEYCGWLKWVWVFMLSSSKRCFDSQNGRLCHCHVDISVSHDPLSSAQSGQSVGLLLLHIQHSIATYIHGCSIDNYE